MKNIFGGQRSVTHDNEGDISLHGSVLGLIGLSKKLQKKFNAFVQNVVSAPPVSRSLLSEIGSTNGILVSLQPLLDPSDPLGERAALLRTDYIYVSFTHAMFLLDDVLQVVSPLLSVRGFQAHLWIEKHDKLDQLVLRLQWQNMALWMQLSIFERYENDGYNRCDCAN